jgi:hypothetical protein
VVVVAAQATSAAGLSSRAEPAERRRLSRSRAPGREPKPIRSAGQNKAPPRRGPGVAHRVSSAAKNGGA